MYKTQIAIDMLRKITDDEVIQALTQFQTVKEAKTWIAEEDWIALGMLEWPPREFQNAVR
jgi:hypothetical protein